jgi:hypothetical protein
VHELFGVQIDAPVLPDRLVRTVVLIVGANATRATTTSSSQEAQRRLLGARAAGPHSTRCHVVASCKPRLIQSQLHGLTSAVVIALSR